MRRNLFGLGLLPNGAVLIVFLQFSALAAAQDSLPDWTRVAEKAAFTPCDSCAEAVFLDRMWLLGGWLNSFENPPRDVWSSADGIEWRQDAAEAPWKHSDFPMALVFNDRMWLMGGWHGGRLDHASASNAVWSTADGVAWKQETEAAGWSPRMAAGAVVFKDRMWILGGTQKYYFGDDNDLKNDVWSTADGATWDQAVEHAPWSPRAYLQAVVHDGRIWVLAGGNYLPNYQAKNDVWSSPDGVHWTEESSSAPWPPRIWFSAVAYRDHLWVLGGWSNNPSRNWNDVWYSRDGREWKELKTENVWALRHEHSAYVFQDQLWIVGGHAAPLSNEVWRLDLPTEWPK